MTDDIHQRAQTYNTAMVGVGYAGIFALLSYTHADLTVGERGTAAICLLISLVVFVAWVVGNGIKDTLNWQAGLELQRRLWLAALCGTLGPAIIASGAMFKAYWRMLF